VKKEKRQPRKAAHSDKRAITRFSEQAEFLETVLESLTHPFYVIDAEDFTIKMANSAARLGRLTGTTTCYALTHKKERPCGTEAHPCPLEIVRKTKKPVTVEHVHYDRSGNARNVEVHGFPIFDGDGRVVQMIEYCLDVTDRKRTEKALQESEQRYRSFVQNFQGIVFQGTLDFMPIFFHGAVEEITGYREDEFTAGKPRWDQIIYPDDLALISEAGANLRTTVGYAIEREYRIVHKSGQIRWVRELIQNVCDDSGKPSLVQGVLYDVTERKRMEEDLREYREHLEELVQARTTELTKVNKRLLAEIERRKALERELLKIVERERQRIGQELHDSLGQQLTGIAFMMEVLSEKLAAKSLAEEAPYAEKINARVGRAAELARHLAKGLHPIDLDRNGLVPVLQELAADTEQLFNVSCTFASDEAVSVKRISAAINLYRIAQEAITNAVKHGKARNIKVQLNSRNGNVVLSVANDGLDFPAEPGRAEGMGLKIMRYRAELMNSSLDIRKGARGGTTVTCVLPKPEATKV
jgi:two-component system, NarL family, sensor histidine kinase UhpB